MDIQKFIVYKEKDGIFITKYINIYYLMILIEISYPILLFLV